MPSTRETAAAAKRRKLRGFGSDPGGQFAETAVDYLPAIDVERAKKFQPIVKLFNLCAEKLGGININNKMYTTWEAAIKPEAGEWTLQTFKVLLRYYLSMVKSAKKNRRVKKTVDQSTLFQQSYRLLAAYSFFSGNFVTDQLRQKVKDAVNELSRDKKLEKSSFVRASLTVESIYALSSATPKLRLPIRQTITLATYQATASSTGLRSCGLLRYRTKRNERTKPKTTGLRYRDVGIWMIPNAEGLHNDVCVWITPRISKSKHVVDTSFPSMSNGRVGTSANLMILLSAAVDGALGGATLETLFNPEYLGPENKARQVELAKSRLDNYIFVNPQDRSIDGRWLNKQHKVISYFLGFERVVLSHDFRHLAAAAVFWKYDMETVGQVLQHRFGSEVAKRYLGDSLKYTASTKLSGVDQDRDYVWKTTRTDALSDDNAPTRLSYQDLIEVMGDERLTSLKQEQVQHRLDLSKLDAAQRKTSEVYQKYVEVGRRWTTRLRGMMDDLWKKKRLDYFNAKRTGEEQAEDEVVEAALPLDQDGKQEVPRQADPDTDGAQDCGLAEWDVEILSQAIETHFMTQSAQPLKVAFTLLSQADIKNQFTKDARRNRVSELLSAQDSAANVIALFELIETIAREEGQKGSIARRNSRPRHYRDSMKGKVDKKGGDQEDEEAEEETEDDESDSDSQKQDSSSEDERDDAENEQAGQGEEAADEVEDEMNDELEGEALFDLGEYNDSDLAEFDSCLVE